MPSNIIRSVNLGPSSGNGISISTVENISSVLGGLTEKEILKLMKAGVRIAGQEGAKIVKAKYKTTGRQHPAKRKGKVDKSKLRFYGKNPILGIRGGASKSQPGTAYVNIKGDARLWWFEYGTESRITRGKKLFRKGRNWVRDKSARFRGYRGKISPRPFFMPAIAEIKGVIGQLYEKGFEKAVQNLIKRKQKQMKKG
jgi:hypothetical protein